MILKMADIGPFLLFCILNIVSSQRNPCPCQKPEWCKPVTTPPGKEVFVFSVSNKNWHGYDWDKITSIVQFGYYDPAMVCFAHSKGKRVIAKVDYPAKDLPRQDLRGLWIAKQVQYVKDNFLDGINIDFEEPIPKDNTTLKTGLTSLLKETSAAFKKFISGSQITFDAAWSPDCIGNRCYDYLQLSQYVDFLFIMAYDIRSQIHWSCIAWANSAYNDTMFGVQTFLKLGIKPDKLVLGLPWYGYLYPCINLTKGNTCFIPKVPHAGYNCSDAAGTQLPFSVIQEQYLKASKSGRMWDTIAQSPYFTYQDLKAKKWYQVWYDDPESLKYKYDLAGKFHLRGVGMWEADAVNYTDSQEAKKDRNAMWGALPSYKIFG